MPIKINQIKHPVAKKEVYNTITRSIIDTLKNDVGMAYSGEELAKIAECHDTTIKAKITMMEDIFKCCGIKSPVVLKFGRYRNKNAIFYWWDPNWSLGSTKTEDVGASFVPGEPEVRLQAQTISGTEEDASSLPVEKPKPKKKVRKGRQPSPITKKVMKKLHDHLVGKENVRFNVAEWALENFNAHLNSTEYTVTNRYFNELLNKKEITRELISTEGRRRIYIINPTKEFEEKRRDLENRKREINEKRESIASTKIDMPIEKIMNIQADLKEGNDDIARLAEIYKVREEEILAIRNKMEQHQELDEEIEEIDGSILDDWV